MGKKLNITETRKQYLKDNFEDISRESLSGDERRYYTLIENGKRSAKTNVRFEGKYLSGDIVNVIKKVAERKNMELSEYLDQNATAVNSLIEQGYVMTDRRPEVITDLIHASKRKTIEVYDGDGIVRMSKLDAIELIVRLQQFASSSTTIVQMGINTKIFSNNKIRITLPSVNFEEMTEEEFEDLLDELGIWYVKSAKKG